MINLYIYIYESVLRYFVGLIHCKKNMHSIRSMSALSKQQSIIKSQFFPQFFIIIFFELFSSTSNCCVTKSFEIVAPIYLSHSDIQ